MKKPSWLPSYSLTAIVTVAILYLTLAPKPFGDEGLPLFEGADKLAHCCMFGGLTLTYIFERKLLAKPISVRGALIAAIVVSTFGILIEFVQQGMDSGRSGDLLDAICDISGSFAAIPFSRLFGLLRA